MSNGRSVIFAGYVGAVRVALGATQSLVKPIYQIGGQKMLHFVGRLVKMIGGGCP